MIDVHDLEQGDSIEVTHEHEVPPHSPDEDWDTVEQVDVGVVTWTNGSNEFTWLDDDFDFDYQLVLASGERGATRSVHLDEEKVCHLHYDAGGDRDWDTYQLVDVQKA